MGGMGRSLTSPSNRDLYDLWADTYPATPHNPLMRLEQEVVEPLLARLKATRALDVGTGSGRYLPLLAATGAKTVVGVDFSIAMLTRRAKALRHDSPESGHNPSESGAALQGCEARHACRICGDATRLPFRRGAFDLVNASLMVGDVVELRAWTIEMARVLARGGQLVYSDFHPSWTQHGWRRTFRSADGASHDVEYAPHAIDEHLAALGEAGLRIVAIREPRFKDMVDPAVKAFRRRWNNPPVVAIFHAAKDL